MKKKTLATSQLVQAMAGFGGGGGRWIEQCAA
jgi:hypothetical protein